MQIARFYLFMILLVTDGVVLVAQVSAQDLEQNLDDRFSGLVDQHAPGSAIAVVKAGEVIFNKGYGLADLEHQVPIDEKTVFDLASLSKQFTGYAIALLMEQGQIKPDDDIRKYIPELPDFGQVITIDHLVHHTSGVRDWTSTLPLAGWSFDDIISFEQILRMAYRQKALNFTPGSEYLYSNTGYNLLAELIHRVTGDDFPAWMEAHVFAPLGMDHSFFLDDHKKVIANRASGYSKSGNDNYRVSPNSLTAWGSSSMYSTTTDLCRWTQHLLNPPEGMMSIIDRMFQPGKFNDGTENSYAYGIGVGDFRGSKSISHSGSWASFSTYLTMIPDSELAIIVLCNHANSAYQIAQQISGLFIDETEIDKGKAPKVDGGMKVAEETLTRYQGTYKLGPGWYVEISNRDGNLWTQATGEANFPMLAMTDTSFVIPAYGGRTMTFYKDQSKQVSGLVYNDSRCPKMMKSSSSENLDLSDLIGNYYSSELETSYRVVEVGGELRLWHFRHGEFPLTHAHANEYSSPNWFLKAAEFFTDGGGNVNGFKVWSYRARDQVFKKVD